jgi:hypothetical protein
MNIDLVLQMAPVAELWIINDIPSVLTEKGVELSSKLDKFVASIVIVSVGFTHLLNLATR